MKYGKMISFLGMFLISQAVQADDEAPVCQHCQKIREYNAHHPENNYYWYDDYVKDKKEEKPASNEEEGKKPVTSKEQQKGKA